MGDHDHGQVALEQVVCEPLHAFHVEVVGWLIEHHEVQILHQRGGQVHAAALATGERTHRSIEPKIYDAQSAQDIAHLGIGGPLIGLQFQRLDDHLRDGQLIGQVKALRNHSHAQIRGMGYTAGVGWLDAGEHLQQGGFATAINADDADAIAALHT